MKKKIKSSTLWYAAALCFYVVCIFGFFGNNDFDVLFLCLGSSALCLGSAEYSKEKKMKEENETTEENETEVENAENTEENSEKEEL